MKTLLSALACFGVLVLATSSASAQYAQELTVGTTNPAPGEQVVVQGNGYAPHSDVAVTIESQPILLATTRADARGAFSVRVTIPAGIEPGAHTLKAVGPAPDGTVRTIVQPVTVGGSLSRTGLNIVALAICAGGLIWIGTALIRAHRRGRTLVEI